MPENGTLFFICKKFKTFLFFSLIQFHILWTPEFFFKQVWICEPQYIWEQRKICFIPCFIGMLIQFVTGWVNMTRSIDKGLGKLVMCPATRIKAQNRHGAVCTACLSLNDLRLTINAAVHFHCWDLTKNQVMKYSSH